MRAKRTIGSLLAVFRNFWSFSHTLAGGLQIFLQSEYKLHGYVCLVPGVSI
jgi:hypothetical protein